MTFYVLGEEEVVLGFALIGVPGCAPANRGDALREFQAIASRPQPALLLISEGVAGWIETEIRSAILGGMVVQVIPGIHPARERGPEAEALLLSALGIKL